MIIGKAQRPVLPQTAVLSDTKGSYVLIVDAQEQGRAPRGACRRHDADGVVIAAGLTGTERVVTTAGGFLRDGERVKTVAEASQAPPP